MKPSSFIEYVRLIKGRHWDRVKIAREMKKRVERDDYKASDREALVLFLLRVSNS